MIFHFHAAALWPPDVRFRMLRSARRRQPSHDFALALDRPANRTYRPGGLFARHRPRLCQLMMRRTSTPKGSNSSAQGEALGLRTCASVGKPQRGATGTCGLKADTLRCHRRAVSGGALSGLKGFVIVCGPRALPCADESRHFVAKRTRRLGAAHRTGERAVNAGFLVGS
jgi:hypothetical protein